MQADSPYMHALEGRLRIKIPQVKGAAVRARQVERHLGRIAGVDYVSANPVTGSVLILYNSSLTAQEEILSALKESGYLPQGNMAAAIFQASQPGVVEKLTTTVAASLMEFALTRLVSALI